MTRSDYKTLYSQHPSLRRTRAEYWDRLDTRYVWNHRNKDGSYSRISGNIVTMAMPLPMAGPKGNLP